MTVATGQPIISADLNSVWDSITTLNGIKSTSRYEFDVASFNLDSVTVSGDNTRIWVPSTDAQILGAIVVSTGAILGGGFANFLLQGNLNQNFAIQGTVTAGSSVRTFTAAPDGTFMALAGDIIRLTVVSLPGTILGPTTLRVHIIYKTKWSRI